MNYARWSGATLLQHPGRPPQDWEDEMQTAGVTQLLADWSNGDKQALNQLMPMVYEELSRMAAGFLRHERPDHTLQTSALVHEAYFRLIEQRHVEWHNRAHFFGIAAQIMRRILVDYARHHGYAKRGGGAMRIRLEEAESLLAEREEDLVALDDALTDLAKADWELARIVELRYFGGLSVQEIGEVCGISTATVNRKWRTARAWLYHTLKGNGDGP